MSEKGVKKSSQKKTPALQSEEERTQRASLRKQQLAARSKERLEKNMAVNLSRANRHSRKSSTFSIPSKQLAEGEKPKSLEDENPNSLEEKVQKLTFMRANPSSLKNKDLKITVRDPTSDDTVINEQIREKMRLFSENLKIRAQNSEISGVPRILMSRKQRSSTLKDDPSKVESTAEQSEISESASTVPASDS